MVSRNEGARIETGVLEVEERGRRRRRRRLEDGEKSSLRKLEHTKGRILCKTGFICVNVG